ncbi:TrkH family potassium uptake protein [Aliishimia ponticola]|uniref:TrkH family potassium uptake protein n=1 Tax=Aliishimia ponticola TaxID=2499833 RepID=A0A4S4NIL4_9RHOB|nr:potassium transporter TrkG [Aliishimia ponticola]THH38735.1 TrkH family potassium uptake protein [Aliishimia ponticola]
MGTIRPQKLRRTPGFWQQVSELPIFLLAFGIAAISMLVPALHGLILEDFIAARMFFYASILGTILFALIGIALSGREPATGPLGPLLSLFSIMVILPVGLAVPFFEALRTTAFFNAYLEMVSAITTTGAPVFDDPTRLSDTLHLWRAQVAWMGGFVMWVAAVAILAPLNLGGFEVTARAEPGQSQDDAARIDRADTHKRLIRSAGALLPIYVGLTLLLWVVLLAAGDRSLVALVHAMSVMSTSGISPIDGPATAGSGLTGEILLVLFMVFAVSRLTFSTDTVTVVGKGLHTDPEIQLAVAIVVSVPLLLFLRHWAGAFEVDQEEDIVSAALGLWGSFFTVTSFLSTTGFVSSHWGAAQGWSGLETPGLILMAVALVGGGVATTAGGVKLLRVFALYRHGLREMDRLVYPSSVSGARGQGRRLQRQGAFIAWIFFMLFALSLTAVSLLLASLGLGFEEAMVLSVAGLANTGPLIDAAGENPIPMVELSGGAKAVFCAAMVVGRMETLAIIALLTPELWRT